MLLVTGAGVVSAQDPPRPAAQAQAAAPSPANPPGDTEATASDAELEKYYGRTIAKIIWDIPPYMETRVIQRMSKLKERDVLWRWRVRQTLRQMYLLDQVANVAIQVRPVGEQIEVTIKVRPRYVLRDIVVAGASSYSSREVLDDILHIESGDDYRPELLEEYRRKIEAAYAAIGKFQARITITPQLTQRLQDNFADLHIEIKENETYKVTAFDFSEALLTIYTPEQILDAADFDPPFKFEQERIDRGLARLEKWLRKAGHLEARLPELSLDDPASYTIDHAQKTVTVHLPVRVGPRIKIIYDEECFTCTERKWNLDDVLGLDNQRRFNRYIAQDFAKKVRLFLMREGYYTAIVDLEYKNYKDPDGASVREIRLKADRGPKVHIRSIEFLNNAAYDGGELRGLLTNTSVYVEEDFEKDLQNVINFYNSHGFLQARMVQVNADYDEAANAIDVTIDVEEGPQTMVRSIVYEGYTVVKRRDLRLAVEEKRGEMLVAGQPFNPFQLPKMKAVLLSVYLTRGYIKARVKEEVRFSEDNRSVDIVFRFTEGRQFLFGHLYYRGNKMTRKHVIERELVIVPGEPYNYEKIFRSQQALIALGLFTSVDIRPVSQTLEEDAVDMMVEVKERKSGYITGGLGWNSYPGFNAAYEMGHRNLAGHGRRLGFRFEGTVNDPSFMLDQSLFAVFFTWPWIARVPLDGSLTVRDQVQHQIGFDDRAYGAIIGTTLEARKLFNFLEVTGKTPELREFAGNIHTHRWVDPVTLKLDYDIYNDYIFNVSDAVQDQVQGQTIITALSPMLIVDRRDDIFNPTRWSYDTLRFDLGTPYLLSQVNFLRVTGRSSWYLPLFEWLPFLKGWVFAENLAAGHVQLLREGDLLPISQRFFLGGSTTVRGFEPNEISPVGTDGRTPVGGYFMAYQNTELRVPLNLYSLGLIFFFDAGNVTGGTNNFYLDRIRTSAGLGLAFLTPVGPLSANYGFKLNRLEGESFGAFYISVGNMF